MKWASSALALADMPVVTFDSSAGSARRQRRLLIVELCYHDVRAPGVAVLANAQLCALLHGEVSLLLRQLQHSCLKLA